MIEAFSSVSRLVSTETATIIVKLALVVSGSFLVVIGLYFIAVSVSGFLDLLCKRDVPHDHSRCICHKARAVCNCRPLEMGAHDDR